MNHIMKKMYLGIVLSLWSISLIAADAGWINGFNGNSDSYTIKRGNETVPTKIFSILQVGDIVSINKSQHSIELYLNGGKQLFQINQQNSPFKITEDAEVSASSSELWIWMKERFNDWSQLTQLSTASEISQDINMPLLSNILEPVALIVQDRDLYLQWQGGNPPYTVELQKRLDSLSNKKSSTTTVKLDKIKFESNSSYRIKILDSKGQSFIGGFKTVESTQIPFYKSILNNNLPAEISKTLQAIWLAKQNNGEWIFEAYQQLAPFASYQPAKLLQDALARGQGSHIIRGIRG